MNRAVSIFALASLLAAGGCQLSSSDYSKRLIQYQSLIDYSGLNEVRTVESVKANVAWPQKWQAAKLKRGAMYTDAQWRCPNQQAALGVAYVRMPLPLSARTLLWLAKREYARRGESGEVLGEWTDDLGRPWFEAQSARYRIRGYVVTKGFEAWMIYCGYKRTNEPPSAADLGLAARALETVVPTPFAAQTTRNLPALAK